MDAPTAADVRLWSPPLFSWADAGYPQPSDPSDDVRLDVRVQWVTGEVLSITGRTLEDITSPQDVALAQQVIVLKAMVAVLGGTKAALKVLEAPWLKSFAAGSYSETRFSPAEIAGTQGRGTERMGSLGPEPIATLLLMLMTDAKREEWLWLIAGKAGPAGTLIDGGFDSPHHGPPPMIDGQGIEAGWPWGWPSW